MNHTARSLVGFILALAVLGVVGWLNFHHTTRMQEMAAWVEHTRQVQATLNQLALQLSELESSSRGYALSGKESFQAAFNYKLSNIPPLLESIRALTQDNPRQQTHCNQLAPLIAQRIEASKDLVDLRRTSGLESAGSRVEKGPGSGAMEQIRALMDGMINEEQKLLASRSAAAQEESTNAKLYTLSGIGLSLAILGAIFALAKMAELAAEEARREAALERERLKFVFDHLPVGVSLATTDSNGHKSTIINDAHLGMCGLTRQEAADSTVFKSISHPEDYKRQEELFRKLDSGQITHFSMDKRYLRRDGTVAWVIFSYLRRDFPDGRREDLSFVVDITKRKQAEEALRASEENLSVTLHCIGDGVLSTDVEGRVIRLNAVAEKLTGWSSQEAAGKPVEEIFQIISEETGLPASVPLRKVMETGQIRGLANHTALIARDGTVRSIANSAAPIHSFEGGVVGAVLVFRDVTEETRLYQELHQRALELEQARADADRANQAKSEYLSRMSHEFRTPLNAILGFGQLLEQDVKSPEDKESVDQILKAGRHLLEMINELLDLARIEAGRLRISHEPVLVRELLHDCVQLIRPLAEEREIRLMEECQAERDGHVLADRQRLKQVLLNLLSNAIKYNRDEGRVVISCQTTENNQVQIRIADTGAGISQDNMARLFSPFERIDSPNCRVEGTGLGLSLSKRLVELMGGSIGVESVLGMGSTFSVSLARAEAPLLALERQLHDLPAPVAPPASLRSQHKTVLYIEDNLSNLRLIERILAQRPGVELIPAMQGKLGLELARNHNPDLVLLDLNLPDMHGGEVLLRLRAEPMTAHVPVVVISADATAGEIERLRASGAQDYLTKPYNVGKLLGLLDAFLSDLPEPASSQAPPAL